MVYTWGMLKGLHNKVSPLMYRGYHSTSMKWSLSMHMAENLIDRSCAGTWDHLSSIKWNNKLTSQSSITHLYVARITRRLGGQKRILVFTGDLDDICPITLVPARDLKWAVAFCEDTDHAYECTALVQWLGKRWRNPMTNKTVQIPRRRRSRSLWSNFCVNNVDWVIQLFDICTDIAASAAYIWCHHGVCSSFIQFLNAVQSCDALCCSDIRPFCWMKNGAVALMMMLFGLLLTYVLIFSEWTFVVWTL